MVGGEGGSGGAAAELTATLRDAYDAAAPAWTHGAERVYLPLAQALAAQAEVAGKRVLDLGAGTGVAIAASSFAPGWTDPAKDAVDAALRPFGYLPPAWYLRFKQETEPAAGDPEVLAAQLAAAGFGEVRIRAVTVKTGVSAPAERAAWRLGMAHVAPFISSLPAGDATAARQAAERAVAASAAGPLTVSLLVTTAS